VGLEGTTEHDVDVADTTAAGAALGAAPEPIGTSTVDPAMTNADIILQTWRAETNLRNAMFPPFDS
jgi:hypothetical protein